MDVDNGEAMVATGARGEHPERRPRRIRRALALGVLALAVALATAPAPLEAGWLKGVTKAMGGRLGKARPQANAGAVGERAALGRELRHLDEATLARIERRFGAHLAPERLRQAQATPSQFLAHGPYQGQLRRAYPELSAGERQGVLGNYRDGRTYLDRNQVRLPRVTAHERLHQLADPRFRAQAGSRLDEGVTEHFAGRIYGDLGLRELPRIYPQEGRVVQQLRARVGEPLLARAYFRGELTPLRHALDGQLGRGRFDDLVGALARGDYRRAEALLK